MTRAVVCVDIVGVLPGVCEPGGSGYQRFCVDPLLRKGVGLGTECAGHVDTRTLGPNVTTSRAHNDCARIQREGAQKFRSIPGELSGLPQLSARLGLTVTTSRAHNDCARNYLPRPKTLEATGRSFRRPRRG